MIKRLDDFEAIFKQIRTYLTEEVETTTGMMSRLNAYITLKNAQKGDSLLELIPDEEEYYVLGERRRDFKNLSDWIDISAGEDSKYDSNFNTVAKLYVIAVSFVIQDDYSDDVFFKSIRMAEVLTDVMSEFFKDNTTTGLMYAELQSSSVPDRVSLTGDKALKSGILYSAIVQ